MKLTTKIGYRTRAMLDLALNTDHEPLSLAEIAERQEVSVKYLERLFAALHSSGLVRAVRGAHGGYQLTKGPAEITLRRLYEVLEGTNALVDCVADPKLCGRSETCVTQQIWAEMSRACMNVLDSVTLADVVQRALEVDDGEKEVVDVSIAC